MSSCRLSASFKDRLCFEAHSDYLLNTNTPDSLSPPKPSNSYLPRQASGEGGRRIHLNFSLLRTRLNGARYQLQARTGSSKAWRWVDFNPKYHTQSVRSPGMRFHGENPLEKTDGRTFDRQTDNATTTERGKQRTKYHRDSLGGDWGRREVRRPPILMTPSGGYDDGRYRDALRHAIALQVKQGGLGKEYSWYERGQSLATGRRKPFRTRFRCSRTRDDRVEKARERREFVVYPYSDPQPFDHRGLDLEENRLTQLRTSVSPTPLDYKLPKNQPWKTKYTGDAAAYWARDINFKLKTLKSPEPHYDRSLLLEKGEYSPAFAAYNAFLDRVGRNVTYED